MNTLYIDFKNLLPQLRALPNEQRLVTLYENEYFKQLASRISNNFNIDTDALRSEGAIAWLQSSWFKRYVVNENVKFSGRVFVVSLKKIAVSIKKAEQLLFEDIDTFGISIEDPADSLITQYDKQIQEERLPSFKEKSLGELLTFREKIINGNINIQEYARLIGINIADIMKNTGISSRYKICRQPQLFRDALLALFDEYIQLWHKWFMREYVYIEHLKQYFGTTRTVYEKFAPQCSYRNFLLWLESPSYWDMELLYSKFGEINA